MKITWLGHSCFRLDSAAGSLVLDPYADGSVPGLTLPQQSADAVLCSHYHDDHGAAEKVTLTGRPCGYEVGALECFHDEAEGAKLLFEKYKAELVDTMTMCGAQKLSDICADMVYQEK